MTLPFCDFVSAFNSPSGTSPYFSVALFTVDVWVLCSWGCLAESAHHSQGSRGKHSDSSFVVFLVVLLGLVIVPYNIIFLQHFTVNSVSELGNSLKFPPPVLIQLFVPRGYHIHTLHLAHLSVWGGGVVHLCFSLWSKGPVACFFSLDLFLVSGAHPFVAHTFHKGWIHESFAKLKLSLFLFLRVIKWLYIKF